MRSERWALAALLMGCGAPAARADGPDPRVDQALSAVQALRARLARVEGELSDTRRRLAAVERRAGLAPFRPQALSPWRGGERITLPRGLKRLDGPRARGKKARPPIKGPYVLAFWATWCKPCTTPEELDRLRWLRRELRSDGLTLLSVAIDGLDKVKRDRRAKTWLYPLWQGDDAHVDALPRAFIQKAGMGLPLFAVVDGQGRLRYTRAKALDDAAVVELAAAARSLD